MKKDPKKSEKKSFALDSSANDFRAFAKKIGSYFNTEPQKERVLKHEDFNAAGDVYYASVSAHYKVAQRILGLFLAVFLVISIFANYKEITYDNFFYLLKDFTSAADAGNNYYETLSYESDSRQRFTLYRGGIASVSPSKISIFTATGRRTLNEASAFSSPFAVSSDKYVLFYDTAGNTFSIYNSFARVYTEKLDYPVKCASLAKDGSFAVAAKAETGFWTVRIYTKAFKLKSTIESKEHIFGICLDSDSKKLSVTTYEAGNGTGKTCVTVYDLSKMSDKKGNEITVEKELIYDGEFPIKAGFIGKKHSLALITDSYVRVFDNEYEEAVRSSSYGNGNITGYYLDKDGVAVSVMESAVCNVIVFNEFGDTVFDNRIDHIVSDIFLFENFIFLQTNGSVVRIDTRKKSEQELVVGNGKMLVYNEKTVLVCGESKAEYLIFDN